MMSNLTPNYHDKVKGSTIRVSSRGASGKSPPPSPIEKKEGKREEEEREVGGGGGIEPDTHKYYYSPRAVTMIPN